MRARENPFRSECLDALDYRADGFDWQTLEAQLRAQGGRGALVGPQGRGKSTLLRAWHKRSPNSAFVKLEFGQRRLTPDQRETVAASGRVFLDSAEQLGWWGWPEARHLTRNAETVVITSHRAGLLPTILKCHTSPELLSELVHELSGEDRDCHALWTSHQGNIRHALRSLYDAAADDQDGGSRKRGQKGGGSTLLTLVADA